MPKDDDKSQVFDVSRPANVEPSPTSRPIIVGHQPIMNDPMVRENAPQPVNVGDDSATHYVPVSVAPAVPAEPTIPAPIPEPMPQMPSENLPQLDTQPTIASETPALPGGMIAPGSTAPAVAAVPHQPMPAPDLQAKVESHPLFASGSSLPAGKKRRFRTLLLWSVLVLIILAGAYAAVDAFTSTKLPYEFFKKSTPVAQQPVITPAEEEFELPANWVWYENKDLGFKFAYPEEWGEVELDELDGTNGRLVSFVFAATEDVEMKSWTTDFEAPIGGASVLYGAGYRKEGNLFYSNWISDKNQIKDAQELKYDQSEYLAVTHTGLDAVSVYEVVVNTDGAVYPGVAVAVDNAKTELKSLVQKVAQSVTTN